MKSPRTNGGSGSDRKTEKNQPQINYDQRNDSEQNNGIKNGASQRTRVNQPDNGNSNSERKSSVTNERNSNKQQSAPVSQPRQSEQRNSNSNGSRPRH